MRTRNADHAPVSGRSPDSGVRLRVRPEEEERSSIAAAVIPLAVAPRPAAPSLPAEDELALEDAVPFSGNTAVAAVFAFALTAAGGLVAAGLYL